MYPGDFVFSCLCFRRQYADNQLSLEGVAGKKVVDLDILGTLVCEREHLSTCRHIKYLVYISPDIVLVRVVEAAKACFRDCLNLFPKAFIGAGGFSATCNKAGTPCRACLQ